MRIVVTEGRGYVGSHAVRELGQRRHEVIIYDNLWTSSKVLTCAQD